MRQLPDPTSLSLDGQTVLLRCDVNVPISNGTVTNEFRIDAHIPTLEYLISKNAKVVMFSHLGRPDGKKVPEMSLKPVQAVLQAKLGKEVEFIEDILADDVPDRVKNAPAGSLFLLENVRFYAAEESENEDERAEFAQKFLALGDIYINEGYGDYRPHASNYELAKQAGSKAFGFRFCKEVSEIDKLMSNPERPYVAVIGGAKLSSKLVILEKIADVADRVLIGGAMAYTLLAAQGHTVGKSLYEPDKLDLAKNLLGKYGDKLVLPVDHVAAASFSESETAQHISGVDIPEGMVGMDIGTQTIELYINELDKAKTILWNGPLGVFEWDQFATGTKQVGNKIADQAAHTVVGGGETITAMELYELEYGMDHISVGGGATLDYIASGTLPTIDVLLSALNK